MQYFCSNHAEPAVPRLVNFPSAVEANHPADDFLLAHQPDIPVAAIVSACDQTIWSNIRDPVDDEITIFIGFSAKYDQVALFYLIIKNFFGYQFVSGLEGALHAGAAIEQVGRLQRVFDD